MVVDHLSHLVPKATPSEELSIDDSFQDEQLLAISQVAPWYADLANYKVCGVLPSRISHQRREKFLSDAKYYVWEEPLLYKLQGYGVYRRCLPEEEGPNVLHHCDASTYDGHFGIEMTITKVPQVGFYWPMIFKDGRGFVMMCDKCQ